MIKNQLTKEEAQKLFDYRGSMLYWRHRGSGRRRDLRAVTFSGSKAEIKIGENRYQARYVVWNWHHGVTKRSIECVDGDNKNIDISNIKEKEEFITAVSTPSRAECPCCGGVVPTPPPEMLSSIMGLTRMEERIFMAVWRGKGYPVETNQIFDAMYQDDMEGGPSQANMYSAFKVSLHKLRKKLEGHSIKIENNGYGRGYRLAIGE